jgi:hypothetical protein
LTGVAITRRRKQGNGFRVAVPVLGSRGVALAAIESTIPDLADAFPPLLAALHDASRRLAKDPALRDADQQASAPRHW